MKVKVGAATDIGRVREGNEDAYLLLDPLYAVADGMGGHLGGEVAANLAIETIRDLFSAGEGTLTEQVERANRVVFERSRSDREVRGMGTTLTAALVQDRNVRLAHVGDSRAYLFRDGRLHMLTKDHTLVARMIEDGEITEAEAETHPHRSVVTRVLGIESTVQVDEGVLEVRDGDRLLVCSDGLTGMVSDDDVATVLREVPGAQEAADRLVRAANDAGGVDNITAVLLDFAEDGPSDGAREAVPEVRAIATPVSAPSVPVPPAPDARDEPAESRTSRRMRRAGVGAAVTLAVVVIGIVALRVYLDSQWFVGVSNGRVAIFRGVPAEVAGVELNSVVVETPVPAEKALALALYRDVLPDGITASERAAAESIVATIRADVARARPTGQ